MVGLENPDQDDRLLSLWKGINKLEGMPRAINRIDRVRWARQRGIIYEREADELTTALLRHQTEDEWQ